MENKNSFRLTFRALLLIGMSVVFLLSGCQTGALKDQVMMLSEKQIFLARERDSLLRLLDTKIHEFDAIKKDYNTQSTNFKTLVTKNKSLQSGYYLRGVQLQKVTQENAEMSNSIVYQIAKNDSLQNELKYLQEKIAALNKVMADAQMNNTSLAQTVKQQEDKIITDSIAEATKPEPPVFVKKSGFISITEIGGGFGLGDVSTDYSRSLFSLNTIAAFRVNDHFLTGLGTGVHAYNGGSFIPLYIDMRYSFKQAMFTPFITADGGVLFNLEDFNSSGLFLNPAFGLEKRLNERLSLHLSTGILVKEPPDWLKASFINFKVGVSFRGK